MSIPSSQKKNWNESSGGDKYSIRQSIKQLSTHFPFKIADRKKAIMYNKKEVRSFYENENFLNYDAFKTSLIYRHTRLYMQITLSL